MDEKRVKCKDCDEVFVPEDSCHQWCASCTASINHLQEAQAQYQYYAETTDDDEWYA